MGKKEIHQENKELKNLNLPKGIYQVEVDSSSTQDLKEVVCEITLKEYLFNTISESRKS